MPVEELAGRARERVSRAVHRAAQRGEDQLAAVLLAQSDGYRAAGDPAGALHLVQQGLTLEHVEPRTRERLLDSGVELTIAVSELGLARQYAAELLELIGRRGSPEDPETLRDLSAALNQLGDVTRMLGAPATAATYHQQALDIRRRLAKQLGTVRALQDLWAGLLNLAWAEEVLGNAEAGTTLRSELATVSHWLTAVSKDVPSPPPDRP